MALAILKHVQTTIKQKELLGTGLDMLDDGEDGIKKMKQYFTKGKGSDNFFGRDHIFLGTRTLKIWP